MRDSTLLSIGLLGLGAFLGLSFGVAGQASVALDEAVLRWAVGLGGAPVQWSMRGVTMLGSVPLLFAAVISVAAWCLKRGAVREATLFVGVCGAAELANILLKLWFARPRPLEHALVLPPESHSFPSGHALMGTVVYGLAAILFARLAPELRSRWSASLAALALLVGASRVVLGVHWPSDVLAGFALGVAFLAAGTLALRRLGPSAPRGRERS